MKRCFVRKGDAVNQHNQALQCGAFLRQEAQLIAALYVETDGAYFSIPGIDPWDETRDARKYAGPWPVVAHPPCQRWGRFWHGSTRKPHQFKLGDDGGCFEAALKSIGMWGGVLEHPCDSHAWEKFGINKPPRAGGWIADGHGGWTCCVYQGHYGHLSGKPTWLLACGMRRDELPELRWGKTEQRIHPRALELHGYEKARRIGMMAMVGGKDKTRIRNATPDEFRDVLIAIARSVNDRPIYGYELSSACLDCGGAGMRDSGGFMPWGEPALIPCDCTP